MDLVTDVPFADLIIGIAIGSIGGALVYEWKRRRESQDEIEEWFEKSMGYISRVEVIGHQATGLESANYDVLHDDLAPLVEEMAEHNAGAPMGVPDDAQRDLEAFIGLCTSVLTLLDRNEEITATELLEATQKNAGELADRGMTGEQLWDMMETVGWGDMTDIMGRMEKSGQIPQDIEIDEGAGEELFPDFDENRIESLEKVEDLSVEELSEVIGGDEVMESLIDGTLFEMTRLHLTKTSTTIRKAMEEYKRRL